MATKSVLVPIADGSEDIELVCIIDVLRRAGINVTVASVMPDKRTEVVAARKTRIVADVHIEECKDQIYDLIALPGGLPGAEHLRDCSTLITLLQDQKASKRWYAAICASPAVVFAAHELELDVKTTSHPGFTGKLTQFQNSRTVVDQNCITSQGPGTAIEFALELVELLLGRAKRDEVAAPMVL